MFPDTHVGTFDPSYDLRTLQRLGTWCLRWSPIAGIDPLREPKLWDRYDRSYLYDGLYIDCRGLDRIYNGVYHLALRLSETFLRWNIKARLAFGPTLGAAWALSRFGDAPLVLDPLMSQSLMNQSLMNNGRTANPQMSNWQDSNWQDSNWQGQLHALPLQALRLTPPTHKYLSDLGVLTIGEFAAIPRDELGTRFGNEVLQQYDKLIGTQIETFVPLRESPIFFQERNYESPLHQRSMVSREAQATLQDLLNKLTYYHRKARSFCISFTSENDLGQRTKHEKRFSLYLSTNDDTLQSLLLPLIENIPWRGNLVSIRIEAEATELFIPNQQSMFIHKNSLLEKEQEDHIKHFLNSITTKISRHKIRKCSLFPIYLPEKSFAFSPYDFKQSYPTEVYVDQFRPSLLLEKPIRITVIALLPDHPPHYVMLNTIRRKVIKSLGPERINTPWWNDAKTHYRDYFTIEDEHGVLWWIFRKVTSQYATGEDEWFLHGLWQ